MDLFYYLPLLSAPSPVPISHAFGPYSPKLESYLRIVLDALDLVHDTHSGFSLFAPLPSSFLISFLALVRVSLHLCCLFILVVGMGEGSESRVACNVGRGDRSTWVE